MRKSAFGFWSTTALSTIAAASLCVPGAALAETLESGSEASADAAAQGVPQRPAARQSDESEIVVTARRYEETTQDVPIALSALNADAIENRQIETMHDLAAMVPGLVLEQASSIASTRPTIRGMSQLARVADESNVGVFIDGVYSSGLSGSDLPFEALERVEVVRGPQSALYGRNTFAGAINYVTRRPSYSPEFGGTATIGTHGRWGLSGYASGPLVDDTIAARIDGGISESGGFFRNQVNGERLSNRQSGFVRLGLRVDPVSNFQIVGSFMYRDEDISASPLIVIADDDPRRVGKPAPTRRSPIQIGRRMIGPITDYSDTYFFDPNATAGQRENIRATLSATWDLGGVELQSLTGYDQRHVFTLADLDQTPNGTLFGTTWHQTASGDEQERSEFSQDLRLSSKSPGWFNWALGAYYSRENYEQIDHRYASPALGAGGTTAPAPTPDGRPSTDDRFDNLSVFKSLYASVHFDILPTLNLTVEGRQTWEHKRVLHLESNYGSDRGQFFPPAEGDWSYFTPRAILSWQPSRPVHVYFSAAKGTKSGGFNPTAVIPEEQTYLPEHNWTYELGGKFRLFNNRMRLDMAAYYVDWIDQQTLVFASGTTSDVSIVGNVGKSRIKGFEVEGDYNFGGGVRLNFTYAYTDARYVDAVVTGFANFVDCQFLPNLECPGGVTTGRVDGNDIQFISRHSGAVGAQITRPITGAWDFFARGDVTFQSRRWVDAGNIGWIPGREDFRFRIGIQSDRYRLHGYCNNVFNDRTPVTAFVSRDFNGNPHYYVRAREGRTCGVTAGFRF